MHLTGRAQDMQKRIDALESGRTEMLSDIKTRQLKMSQLQSQIEEQSTLITKYEATIKQLQEQVYDCVNSHPAEIARLHAELQKYRDKEEKERDAPKRKPFTTRAFLLGFFLKSSSFLFLISMAR